MADSLERRELPQPEVVKDPHTGNGRPQLDEDRIKQIVEKAVADAMWHQFEKKARQDMEPPIPKLPPTAPVEDLSTQLLRYQMHQAQEGLKEAVCEIRKVAEGVRDNELRLERIGIMQKVELAILGVLGTSGVAAAAKFLFDRLGN